MIRLTGSPEGYTKTGRRTTVLAKVKFFADSDALTTIRWYGVPEDRPVMPYPSFVANEVWHNDNGMRSGMAYGQSSTQGVQDEPAMRWVNTSPPHDEFNPEHFCGAADQWAGKLLLANPADVGRLNCCKPREPGITMEDLSTMLDYREGPYPGILLADRSTMLDYREGPYPGILLADASEMTDYRPTVPACSAGDSLTHPLFVTITGSGVCDGTYPVSWGLFGPVYTASITPVFGYIWEMACSAGFGWFMGGSIIGSPTAGPATGTNGPPVNLTFSGVDFTGLGGSAGATVNVHN